MRIVHIEDFFHPDAGYQVNILSKYMAKAGNDVYIITSESDKMPQYFTNFFDMSNIKEKDQLFEEKTGVRVIRMPVYTCISNRSIYKSKLFKVVKDLSPDVVYLHGNDSYGGMRFILKSKHDGMKYVTDSHMLEMASVNKFNKFFYKFYRMFITPTIVSQKIPVIRTSQSKFVKDKLGIPLEQTITVDLGTDETLFYPSAEQRKNMRKILNINDNAFVVLYAGKMDESKGGMLLSDITNIKLNTDQEVVYLIIGNTTGEYGEKIEKNFANSPYRVIRKPTQPYSSLSSYYQCADLAIIPKQCSLSIFDIEACGVPVVCENNDINIERINKLVGRCFKKGDIASIKECLEYYLNLSNDEMKQLSNQAVQKSRELYGFSKQYSKYMNVIESVVKKDKENENNFNILG